ncbi:MAG: glycosyltransferase family 4 protein [Patescibacteria group bacterium]
MKRSHEKMWIVFLATYPPRECGIATFTSDLLKSFDQLFAPHEEAKVIAMNIDVLQTYNYSHKVIAQISENQPADYLEAARKLNTMPRVKLVSIQHEFGIFGEDYGKNILVFLKEIKKPVTITFHTVLSTPPQDLKALVVKIAEHVDRLIVMTNTSKELLVRVYGLPESKISIIGHGIHSLSYTDGTAARTSIQLSGKRVLSTFGLLNKAKGIEYAIGALPKIVAVYPSIVYLVIGVTHPIVLKNIGEGYRNQLIEQAYRLGVQDHVLFYNEYLKTDELLKFLQATEIYLSLSQNPEQAVSGTLTYALGAGRPVVSTPFAQAQEVITPELGVLVKFNDSESVAQEVIALLGDQERLINMSKAAYFRTRGITWPNVALSYMREFTELSPELAKQEKNLPAVKLKHLHKLTNDFGIYQFAILDEPDPKWGYTLDDNARALVVVSLYHRIHSGLNNERLAETYLQFLERAAKIGGGFENYFTNEKKAHHTRNLDENTEDAEARALWALATVSTSKLSKKLKKRAMTLLNNQYETFEKVASPRAVAFHIKALVLWLAVANNEKINRLIIKHADFLLDRFNDNTTEDWQWFEQSINYSNAILPEALLLAYKVTGNYLYLKAGKTTLDFLINQSFCGKICEPVGQSGWFKRGEQKKIYDQQPEEVSALVLALRTMFDLSGDIVYQKRMVQTFDWFLGNNLLNQVVYSQMTGGCYDGVGEKQINLNQGAESTISYLLARLAVDNKYQ